MKPVGGGDVVVMTSHDLGRHLHCYGIESVASPNLDSLAAGGVRLEQAFATAPQYDAGLEVALIVRWPGGAVGSGVVTSELVSNIDVLPTLLGWCRRERARRHPGPVTAADAARRDPYGA